MSHAKCIKSITLLPVEDHSSLDAKTPCVKCFSWVRVLRGIYRQDIAYVISANQDCCDVLVVPRRRPYDVIDVEDVAEVKEHKRSQRQLFDPAAAESVGLGVRDLDGIHECAGLYYHRGLLRRSYAKICVEVIEVPHPDRIALYVEAQVDRPLVERTHHKFAAQFWKEGDLVRPTAGSLVGERATIVSINYEENLVTVSPCDHNLAAVPCEIPLLECHCVFKQGDTVKILAGNHRGATGSVLGVAENDATIILETMEVVSLIHCPFALSDRLKVSVPQLFLESFLTPHVLSTTLRHSGLPDDALHAPVQSFDEIMPGDLVEVVKGQYSDMVGTIDSLEEHGLVWVTVYGRTKKHSEDQRDDITVIVHLDDVVIRKSDSLLTYSKEKGYGVALCDTLQVVRGELRGTVGVVRSVDFAKGEVEMVSEVDGCKVCRITSLA